MSCNSGYYWHQGQCKGNWTFIFDLKICIYKILILKYFLLFVEILCQHGYSYDSILQSCVGVHCTPLSFNDAESQCVSFGGHLAAFHSQEEYDALESKISRQVIKNCLDSHFFQPEFHSCKCIYTFNFASTLPAWLSLLQMYLCF